MLRRGQESRSAKSSSGGGRGTRCLQGTLQRLSEQRGPHGKRVGRTDARVPTREKRKGETSFSLPRGRMRYRCVYGDADSLQHSASTQYAVHCVI